MPVDYFIDTNILLYKYAEQDQEKRRIAMNLLNSNKAMASVQVLNEFCNVVRRKFPMAYSKINLALTEIQTTLLIVPLDIADTLSAVNISQRYGFSYYDALILASAIKHGCQAVLSEDMQHGMKLESGLRILNPFIL